MTMMGGAVIRLIVGTLAGIAVASHSLAAETDRAAPPSGARALGRVESITIQSSPEAGGKCIDIRYRMFIQGMPLQIWPCNQTQAQIFSYDFAEKRLTIGGLCVDAWGGQGQRGDPLRLYQCNGGVNQMWSLKPSGHHVKFVGINDLCMDIINESDIVLETCGEAASQNWVVRSAKAP